MSFRVSQIIVQVILLDEYDAPKPTDPVTLQGDAEGSAIEKLRAWTESLPAKLEQLD